MAGVNILETERLALRRLTADDAAFVRELVNEPSWIRFIGDRGVRTLDDARAYLEKGPIAMYGRFGFGLWAVDLKETGEAAGLCGLIKRDALDDVDIGFAFLPRFWHRGYALESARAVLAYGREALELDRIVAITSPENAASIRLLEKIGLRFEQTIEFAGEATQLFVTHPPDTTARPPKPGRQCA
jgi:RimJ/RimL family protein N-acetyltransferase